MGEMRSFVSEIVALECERLAPNFVSKTQRVVFWVGMVFLFFGEMSSFVVSLCLNASVSAPNFLVGMGRGDAEKL